MTSKTVSSSSWPVAVGFGISNPEQAKLVANESDECVVVVRRSIKSRAWEIRGCGRTGGLCEINDAKRYVVGLKTSEQGGSTVSSILVTRQIAFFLR